MGPGQPCPHGHSQPPRNHCPGGTWGGPLGHKAETPAESQAGGRGERCGGNLRVPLCVLCVRPSNQTWRCAEGGATTSGAPVFKAPSWRPGQALDRHRSCGRRDPGPPSRSWGRCRHDASTEQAPEGNPSSRARPPLNQWLRAGAVFPVGRVRNRERGGGAAPRIPPPTPSGRLPGPATPRPLLVSPRLLPVAPSSSLPEAGR